MGLFSFLVPKKPSPNAEEYKRLKALFEQAGGDNAKEQALHVALRKERKSQLKSRGKENKLLAAIHASFGTFVVADCETTGFNPAGNRMIELSAIRYDIDGQELSRCSSLIAFKGNLRARTKSPVWWGERPLTA